MAAGTILRSARLAAGVTQADLAASTGVTQPAISRLERTGKANVDTLTALLRPLGLRLSVAPAGVVTVAEAALEIRDYLDRGLPAFRALVQLTNDLTDADPATLRFATILPPSTSHKGYDAYIAALVEHLLVDDAPEWVNDPSQTVSPDWVVTPYPDDTELEAIIRAATPPAFAKHGVFVHADDLSSV